MAVSLLGRQLQLPTLEVGSCGTHDPWQPLSNGACGVGAPHSLGAQPLADCMVCAGRLCRDAWWPSKLFLSAMLCNAPCPECQAAGREAGGLASCLVKQRSVI